VKKSDILKLNGRELTLLIYQRLRDKIITQEQAKKIINWWKDNKKGDL